MTSHVSKTSGGMSGHLLRRAIHIFTLPVLTILYYQYGSGVALVLNLKPHALVIVVLMATVTIEIIRLKLGLVVLGQRHFENEVICSAAWGGIGGFLLFLLSPRPIYTYVIVLCCALVDPLIGELRPRSGEVVSLFCGFLMTFLIWFVGSFLGGGYPGWYALVMAPFTILMEFPKWTYFDDNITMLLGPLLLLLLLGVK